MPNKIQKQLAAQRLVPVVRLEQTNHAKPLAEALIAGGLPVAEITLRTPSALPAIEQLADRDDLLIGAGTVLNRAQAADSVAAGAQFIVSPGYDPELVEFCLSRDLPVFPGVSSATEIQFAYNQGLRCVKFFPAEASGGTRSMKALAAPFGTMKFIPTGGIHPENLNEYLALDCTLAVGGSWMVQPSLYADGDFSKVTELTSDAVRIAKKKAD